MEKEERISEKGKRKNRIKTHEGFAGVGGGGPASKKKSGYTRRKQAHKRKRNQKKGKQVKTTKMGRPLQRRKMTPCMGKTGGENGAAERKNRKTCKEQFGRKKKGPASKRRRGRRGRKKGGKKKR